jgi:lipoprotein-anchoring transpeptidase ErfK/SrfK
MKKTAVLVLVALSLAVGSFETCFAQGWPPWADDAFGRRAWGYDSQPRWEHPQAIDPRDRRSFRADGGDIRDGGARPEIAPQAPPVTSFPYDYPANSIVIDTGGRKLYYVLPDSHAYEYAISVGREGFNWTGAEAVSHKQPWPDWYPPAEMRERDPKLPEKMTGGIKNPLGAMALYLGKTLYRIHGTNDAKSIGRAASSGCFRMLNSHVLHLASIAEIGTTVNVVASLPQKEEISRADPVAEAEAIRRVPPPRVSSPETGSDGTPNYQALRDYMFRAR